MKTIRDAAFSILRKEQGQLRIHAVGEGPYIKHKSRMEESHSWGDAILVCAYVLIQTALGKALEVLEEVQKIEEVKTASAVTGAYDIVAHIEVKEVKEIANVVVNQIHTIEGVCRTQTLICVA
jgi:DNA-binding Lrp family transcriptional regulator